MERRTVPAFASFKPRAQAAIPTSSKDSQEEDRDASSTRSRRKHEDRTERREKTHKYRDASRERHRDRKDDRRRREHEHDPGHERQKETRERIPTPPPAQDELEESEYFMIDRRGDAKNVEYGGLHRYSIPSYHRIGYGRVVGANKYAKIDQDTSTEKCILLRVDRGKGGERSERLLTRKSAKHEGRSQRLVLPLAEDADAATSLQEDYMALRPNLKRKRGSESPAADVPEVDYRSVEGKAKADQQPMDEDLQLDSSSDTERDGAADSKIRARNTELSRATKASPTNADAWLALIEHQAHSTFPSIEPDDLISSQRRSVADIRLSIFGQAFKHIAKTHPGHDRLFIAYIAEGSKIWDANKLAQKWKEALKQHLGSILLWREYLNHKQSGHATFRYDRCKDEYLRCLETLSAEHEKAAAGQRSTIANDIVYILLRMSAFTKNAGYDELAIAIWQAVLEYSLFAPESLHDRSKLDAFEGFWENDVPRIGEEGAVGWRASGGSAAPRKSTDFSRPDFDSERPFANFARMESSMTKAFVLPAATADEDDEDDDPFRCVMMSDIKPTLERLPENLDSNLLTDGFLCFIGLPWINRHDSPSREWRSDPYLQGGPDKPITQVHDSFSLFHSGFQSSLPAEACKFVHRALSALTPANLSYEELGEYLLAFLCQINPTEIKKAAKRLLKSRPTSLRYYNAYALAEACSAGYSGGRDKAVQIWKQALTLADSPSEDAMDDTILIWHSWMMTLMHAGNDNAALRLVLNMPDNFAGALNQNDRSVISAGSVLRAKRHLEERLDKMHLKHKSEHLALYADCLAWLHYLSAGHDASAALQSFATTSTKLQKPHDKYALERIHQAKARLLGRHMAAKRPFKPTLFRDELAESRMLFPENSAILEQHYEVAKHTRLDNRLRNALSEAGTASSAAPSGLMSWVFAIDAEIARCSVDGASATKESVRALFRRALLANDSGVKHSPLLWKRWFDIESASLQVFKGKDTRQRQAAVQQAKQVFFDGLRFLPWSKWWIVDGMAAFAESGDMSEEELRQVHDVLVERELRVRADVDAMDGIA